MNTSSKAGIGVEIFANDAEGEAYWAHQDQVTYLKPGVRPSLLSFPATWSAEWPPDNKLRRRIQYATADRF
jgi:hypothetical protein